MFKEKTNLQQRGEASGLSERCLAEVGTLPAGWEGTMLQQV